MTPFLQLVLLLAIILFTAKAAGYLSTLVRQPSVLGELLVGLLIGPSLLNVANLPVFQDHLIEEIIQELAELGVLFLMFVAGLELHFSELFRNGKVSVFAGLLGVLLPVGLGWGAGVLFGFPTNQAVFLGLCLGATSVSISAQTLMELKVLRSKVGMGLLGAAVFDDVLVILLLSAFLALIAGSTNLATLAWIFIRMVVFLAGSTLFGVYIIPKLVRRVSHLPISQSVLSLALVIMFLYGLAAEIVGGMAAITGTFLAGLMFARCPEREQLQRGMNVLSYSLFVPIFFVNIGLSVNIRQLDPNIIWLMTWITLAAIFGKLVGAGVGARLAGLSRWESVQLGAGMVSRGEVGLILASVGLTEGVLTTGEFSAIVGMVIITTLVTPPLLRALFREQKHSMRKKPNPEIEKEAV